MNADTHRRLDLHLEEELPKRWGRWEGHYGPLLGPWIGALETPQRRLNLLVCTVLAATLEGINPTWSADLDRDDQTSAPTAVILAARSGTRVDVIPLAWTGRTLSIGGEVIHLAGRRAGERIIEILATRSVAFLPKPTQ